MDAPARSLTVAIQPTAVTPALPQVLLCPDAAQSTPAWASACYTVRVGTHSANCVSRDVRKDAWPDLTFDQLTNLICKLLTLQPCWRHQGIWLRPCHSAHLASLPLLGQQMPHAYSPDT